MFYWLSFYITQNALLENYATLKELETRAGVKGNDDTVGEVRVLSVSSWPAHDLLLLVRDDLEIPLNSEISGLFGTLLFYLITSHCPRLCPPFFVFVNLII